jgi:hypothetical protein
MKKHSHFDEFRGLGWPAPIQLQRYFLEFPWQDWMSRTNNDCWGLDAEGVEGTGHLEEGKGRIDIRLTMIGNPDLGVLLFYRKYGGGHRESLYSRGDLRRLQEWVATKDGDLMPIGLFIPFEKAWQAVKEFIERDGALPHSIDWIPDRDIPDYAFPRP